jgi:AcrR family transcriptional regulator
VSPRAEALAGARARGRPPRARSGTPSTRSRLLAAAAAACADHGFEGATVADIAARADVSAPAIYNHFGGRAELLVAAARAALGELPASADETSAADVVRSFLGDDFAATRRLLCELHLAAQRHQEVADLLARWHGEQADEWVTRTTGGDPAAVKAFFVLLLGCCHVDSLASLDPPATDVRARMEAMTTVLFPQEAGR